MATGSSRVASDPHAAIHSRQQEKHDAHPSRDKPQVSSDEGEPDASGAKKAHAAEFERPGGDNSIQRFGSEAQGGEVDQAVAALQTYLNARVAGSWGRMCAQLSIQARAAIAAYGGASPALAGKSGMSCAKVASSLLPPPPAAAAREVTVVETAAFRVHGNRGFLLFRGAGGTRYFIRMAHEGGSWKLAAPAPSQLP